MARSSKKPLVTAVQRPKIPVALLVRMFLVGVLAIAACVWAIQRYYFRPRPTLLAPAAPATEIPAPELEPTR